MSRSVGGVVAAGAAGTNGVDAAPSVPEGVNVVASSGASKTLPGSVTATVHDITLTGSPACVLTFPAVVAGASFTLFTRQGAGGSKTATWPAATRWSGGVQPVLSTSVGALDWLYFRVAGAAWVGAVVELNLIVTP
jgi:hypothetical protein